MVNCRTCDGKGFVYLGRPPIRFTCGDCDGRGEISRIKGYYDPTVTFKRMEAQKRRKR